MSNEVFDGLKTQLEYGTNGLYLHASECKIPPSVQIAHSTHLSYRYSHTKIDDLNIGEGAFSNVGKFNVLRNELTRILKKKLKCRWLSLSPLSGMNAVNTVLQSILEKGDIVYSVNPYHGGHPSVRPIIQSLGAKNKWIPFDKKGQINWDFLYQDEENIKLVLINISDSLRVDHVKEVTKPPKGTLIAVDISHYLATYLNSPTKDELSLGVDIILGSTHKNFPGPHKGFIASNSNKAIKFLESCAPFVISSDQSNILLALWVALLEFDSFGNKYVESIQINKLAFCNELQKRGIEVGNFDGDFGNSQQVWILLGNELNARKAFGALECYGIFTNLKEMPFKFGWGLRLGVQELTLLGFSENNFITLANLISSVIYGTEVKKDVEIKVNSLVASFEPMWEKESQLFFWVKEQMEKSLEN